MILLWFSYDFSYESYVDWGGKGCQVSASAKASAIIGDNKCITTNADAGVGIGMKRGIQQNDKKGHELSESNIN